MYDIKDALMSEACSLTDIVIKPTHLLAGTGVIFLSKEGAVSFPKPTGPGKVVMDSWQHSNSRLMDVTGSREDSAKAVATVCLTMLKEPAGDSEAKPLRKVRSKDRIPKYHQLAMQMLAEQGDQPTVNSNYKNILSVKINGY